MNYHLINNLKIGFFFLPYLRYSFMVRIFWSFLWLLSWRKMVFLRWNSLSKFEIICDQFKAFKIYYGCRFGHNIKYRLNLKKHYEHSVPWEFTWVICLHYFQECEIVTSISPRFNFVGFIPVVSHQHECWYFCRSYSRPTL